MELKKIANLSERLNQVLSETSSATELAEKIGMSKQAISTYTTGIRVPKRPVINAIASALGVDPVWLMGFDVPKYNSTAYDIPPGFSSMPETRPLPLVGSIACGMPILAEENIDEYIEVPKNIHADFCLICQGDSMIDARINDGDVVYIRKQPDVEDGEIAAVRIGTEATLKRVYHERNKITLVPANPRYAPMTYVNEELDDICIEGKAVGFTSMIR